MPYSNKLLGTRLREARIAIGLSQRALSLRAGGFPYQVICLVERGHQGVSAERLAQIATALDVSADWLLGLSSEARARADEGREEGKR